MFAWSPVTAEAHGSGGAMWMLGAFCFQGGYSVSGGRWIPSEPFADTGRIAGNPGTQRDFNKKGGGIKGIL